VVLEFFASAVQKSRALGGAGRWLEAVTERRCGLCMCSALCRFFFVTSKKGRQGETKLNPKHRLYPDMSDTQVAYIYCPNDCLIMRCDIYVIAFCIFSIS
jgi:hypothetical protein